MGRFCVGEMKNLSNLYEYYKIYFVLLLFINNYLAQSGFDSLKLIIPIGHGSVINDILCTHNKKYISKSKHGITFVFI
jgi:hypothetical protein